MSTFKAVVLLLAIALFAYPVHAQIQTVTDVFVSTQNASLGAPVTLTAVVDSISPTGSGISTGTVSFYDCASSQPLATNVPVYAATPTNLIPNSDNLQSGWVLTEIAEHGVTLTSSIVSGATDPTGGKGASHLVLGNASYQGLQLTLSGLPSGLTSGPYTFSFWMSTVSGAALPYIVTSTDGTANMSVSLPVTSAWARYSVTYPSLPSSLNISDIAADSYIWGLQLEAGSTAGPYVSTSSPRSSSGGGVATKTISSLAAGSNAIYAIYSDLSAYQGSTSEDTAWVWVKNGTPVTITSLVLPSGIKTAAYTANLSATGGQTPYTWSLMQGLNAPPAGLTLSSSGALTGTPTVTGGPFTFVVDLIDSVDNTAQATVTIPAIIANGTAPWFTSAVPASGLPGTAVTVTGGNFGSTQVSGSVIQFNGTTVAPLSWTDGTIVLFVPGNAAPGPGTITVTVNGFSFSAPFTVNAVEGNSCSAQ